jgi:phosphohistidine phosphatase
MTDHKTLYMVRHAKSNWSAADLNDFDRSLNEQGLQDATAMGKRLKERETIPEVLFCSPARRARQTLKGLNLCIDNVVFDERIYCASKEELIEIIRSVPNQYVSAMIIGHNPAMTWLASHLSGASFDNLPTCAVVSSKLDCSQWAKAGTCPARLLDYDYPRNPV